MRLTGEISQKREGLFLSTTRQQMLLASKYSLPFEIEANRQAKLKMRRGNRANQREAGTLPRTYGSNQNACIKHYSHVLRYEASVSERDSLSNSGNLAIHNLKRIAKFAG